MTLIHFNDCPVPLRAHKFSFRWPGVFEGLQVSVSIPTLKDNTYRVGGDWGPEYSIDMNPGQSIELVYRDASGKQVECSTLQPERLYVESPMLAGEREQTPWVYVINDPEKFITMRLFVDAAGRLHHAQIRRQGHMAFTAMPERNLRLAAG